MRSGGRPAAWPPAKPPRWGPAASPGRLLPRRLDLAGARSGSRVRVSTPYVNTIPAGEEPPVPGDRQLERRVRAYLRWNAAVMVLRANAAAEGIGGHLSTYASSAAL